MSSSPVSTTIIISKGRDSPSLAPQKDYAAAFASLQSTYGANGLAPVLPISLPAASKKTDSSRPRRVGLFHTWGSKKESPEGGLQRSSRTNKKEKKGLQTAFATFRASGSFGRSSVGEAC